MAFLGMPTEGQVATGEVVVVSVTRAYLVELEVNQAVKRGSV